MTLTPKETNMLRHALGLTGRNKITYRNTYYAAGWDAEVWDGLISRGFAIEDKDSATPLTRCFRATRAGFAAVQRKGEKLGPDEERAMRQREAEAA